MTNTGKILVVLNMLMGIFFMAFAMIVYTTRVDLRKLLGEQQTLVAKVTGDLANERTTRETKEKEIADLSEKLTQQQAESQREVTNLQAQSDTLRKELDDFKNRHVRDEKVADTSQDNQNIRNEEIEQQRKFNDELLAQKSELTKQFTATKDELQQKSNDLKLTLARNEEMVTRIGELERYITTITTQYKVPAPEELTNVSGEMQEPPPNIEGIVEKVDKTGRFIQISLGTDDGVKTGNILDVWRNKPEPKYLGKVKVYTAEPTTAVVTPVRVEALIQPNDRVGPKVAPYRTN